MIVLQTIRDLLKFKDYTTIAEIAKFSGQTQSKVLKVINDNGWAVYRNRKNGRITRVDTKTKLYKDEWERGVWYKKKSYGAWSHEGYKLVVHDNVEEKFKALVSSRWSGGLGDSWEISHIEDTPDNRKILEEAGLQLWDNLVVDDRLWKE